MEKVSPNGDYIMRFKVGENVGEGSSAVNEDKSVYDSRKKQVDRYLKDLGEQQSLKKPN